jgi:hypothetical protein
MLFPDKEVGMRALSESRVAPARELIGGKVLDRDGERLGSLVDLAIDVESVRIGYAVLSFGGFRHGGEKLFALPPRALAFDPRTGAFRVDVARCVLKHDPGFDRSAWPDMGDRAWGMRVHAHYGFSPYWE